MRAVLNNLILLIVPLFNLYSQTATDSSLLSKNLDQIVITAQFTPTDTRETVNSVRILNRTRIEQRSIMNLQELLQTESNIRIAQDAILGSDISVNGLKGENLKILIDGVPVVGRLNGNVDAGQIPLSSIQKVEIIEGAQSLLYGSEASGGVINLITRKSQTGNVDTEINSQLESNGFRNLSTRIGYSTGKVILQGTGNIQNFVPVKDSTQGRDQLWNPKKQKSGRVMLRYTPSEDLDLKISGNILNEEVDNLGDKKRSVYKPYAFDDYYTTKRRDLSFHAEKWTKQRNQIQVTLGWNVFSRVKNTYRFDFDEERKTLLDGLQDTSSSSGYLSRVTFASERKEQKLNYILGLENYFETAKGTRLSDSTATDSGKAFTNDTGIFASGKVKLLPELTLQSGARLTWNMRYGSAITPSTWILWKPKIPLQVRSSWAYGFRSPSIKELFFSFVDINHYVTGNSLLKPEKSINLRSEFIWKTLNFDPIQLSLTTTLFYNKVNDRIILTSLGPVHYEYRNVEKSKTKGGSFRINTSLGDWLKFQTEVITTGFNNVTNENQNTNHTYLWSTDWANDLTVNFMKSKLSLNIWHKLTGKTPFFYNEGGKTEQGLTKSWHMLNLGLSTNLIDQRVRVNIGVKNVFNIRQLQANNSNGIHIEASNQQNLHWGRNFYIGLIYQWQKLR